MKRIDQCDPNVYRADIGQLQVRIVGGLKILGNMMIEVWKWRRTGEFRFGPTLSFYANLKGKSR